MIVSIREELICHLLTSNYSAKKREIAVQQLDVTLVQTSFIRARMTLSQSQPAGGVIAGLITLVFADSRVKAQLSTGAYYIGYIGWAKNVG